MKTVLITGAGRRLGADLAGFFARDQFRVALHAHQSIAQARALSDELNAQGCTTIALAADLAAPGGPAALFDATVGAFGVPDVIVNNASIFAHDFPGAVDEALLAASLQVHAAAPIALMDEASRRKALEQRITVFNILDQKLDNYNPDYFSYTVGKAALRGATNLWQSLRRADFRVFGLLPGLIYQSEGQSPERFGEDAHKSPLGGTVAPRAIYEAMGFFLRNEQIAGQDFAIDKGESLTGRPRDVAFE
jgi:NAD(P)-dependent dehydrogenase (short-subunit alcohol dehydrogenase family)